MKGLWALSALVLVAAAPSPAQAQTFSENFDTYVTGSTISGQGGWETWDLSPAANTTVSSAQALTLPNSLLVAGPADIVHRFTGVNSGVWHAKVRVFVPSTQQGEAWFILLNRYAPSALNNNWSVQVAMCVTGCLANTGAVAGMVVSTGGSNNPSTASLPLITNQWVEVRVDIDLTGNTYSVFYNGALLDTRAWQVGGLSEVQAVDLYSNGSTIAFMDDVWLDTTVPVELTTFSVE